MTDTQGNDSPGERWDPRDPRFADLLADALAAEQAAAGTSSEEPSSVSNGAPGGGAGGEEDEGETILELFEALGEPRLEGEAAGAWITRLLADERLRAHLVDVGAARLEAARTALSLRVRTAAQDAFERVGPASATRGAAQHAARGRRAVRAEPVRATGWRPAMRVRTFFAAAALVLVALGAGLYFGASGHSAEAGIQLTSLARVDLAGSVRMSSVEPRYFAALGRVYTPGEDELLSFGFGRDALLVVGAGDAVRVARSALLRRIAADLDDVVADDTLLRLEAGEARLATREGPLLLEVDAAGVLVLVEGAAHVAFDAGDGSGLPAVALAEGAHARFYREDGSRITLAGPSRVRLSATGPQTFGEPARSLFRDLEFFGGPLPPVRPVRFVSPRLWRVVAGPARRGRCDIHLLGGPGGAGATLRLAWTPPPVLADAEILRVALRAPAGTQVSVPGLGDEIAARVEAPAAAPGGEPGTATVALHLPRHWYRRLAGAALELVVTVPGGSSAASARAWFDGASLVLGGSAEEALRMAGEHGRD